MFDFDNWLEIFHIIRKNKLRTFLTGFSVAWGIFMLIILLAAGSGLKNGVMSNFGDRAKNRVILHGGKTSIPYRGISDKRSIQLDSKDFDFVNLRVPESDEISARINTNSRVEYKQEYTNCRLEGVYPVYQSINGIKILGKNGRFINQIDMNEKRKVAVINERLKTVLFKEENAIGENFEAYGLAFKVIGICKSDEWGERAYIPFTTSQQLFKKGWGIGSLVFTVNGLKNKKQNDEFDTRLRKQLAALHQFDPEDKNAVYIRNQLTDYLQTMGIFNGIDVFILLIALGTLIAGIVGVSNIMLITVRERTKEFGIRKALGAKPGSILKLIFMESIFITSIFGYVGMFMGMFISETVNHFMMLAEETSTTNNHSLIIFKDPVVDLDIALIATVALIIAGICSGLIPAYKAVKVTAVEAMRTE